MERMKRTLLSAEYKVKRKLIANLFKSDKNHTRPYASGKGLALTQQ